MSQQHSRRSFLKHSALGGTILGMSPRSYRSVFAAEPPSERVRVGMIGVGNQGGPKNNMKYFKSNITAMCDLDKNYLAEADSWLRKEANLEAVLTDDYRKLLDAKDVDAVVVTVPDQWHAKMTIEACQAGKDVYCEKPPTPVIGQWKPMIEAARKYRRVLDPEFVVELPHEGAAQPVVLLMFLAHRPLNRRLQHPIHQTDHGVS